MMQEENIVDADFEEINDPVQEAEVSAEEPKLTRREVIAALRGAVDMGQLDPKRAKQLREQMGIFQSNFTKRKERVEGRKAKRKAQRVARKIQRK